MYLSKFAPILVVLASALTYVNADAAITAPLNASWKAGSKSIITWQDSGKGTSMPAKFDIELMQGESTSLALIRSIASNVDSSSGQYPWEIPATQAPGKNYAIRIGTATYSPHFEILASDGSSNNNSNTTSGSPSPSQTGGSTDKKSIGLNNLFSKTSTAALIGYVTLRLI